MNIAVVVLAGGEGSRIGGGKPLRRIGKERLVDRAMRSAAQWSDTVALAVRAPAQAAAVDAPLILDQADLEGPLAGLAAGLQFAGAHEREFLLTIPADMPLLPRDLASRLCSAIGTNGAAVSASDGHIHPVCALWRTDIVPEIDSYAASGRRSLKGVAEHVGYVAVEWPCEPHDPFFNVNLPDDLEEAARLLAVV